MQDINAPVNTDIGRRNEADPIRTGDSSELKQLLVLERESTC